MVGFADEARLVGDITLVEPFRAVVGGADALEPVVVPRRRLGARWATEVPVWRREVELQVEGLFGWGCEHLFPGHPVEDVGGVEAGPSFDRLERAAGFGRLGAHKSETQSNL